MIKWSRGSTTTGERGQCAMDFPALAKVFSENKEIRELVKDEALKMIDDDYDVLYILVKDVKLKDNSTGVTNFAGTKS